MGALIQSAPRYDKPTYLGADRDGAVQKLSAGLDRRALLSAGALGGAGRLNVGTDAAEATARNDISILNFALVLEAAFYAEAVRRGALNGDLALFARVVRDHERAHVRALRRTLGRRAVARLKFEFRTPLRAGPRSPGRPSRSTRPARGLQPPGSDSKAILAATLSIHTIEGRHTAWMRDLAGIKLAPNGLDAPFTRPQTLARVRQTKFTVN